MSRQNDMKKIRKILFSELKTLRNNKTDTKRAIAVSRIAAQLINSSRIQNETVELLHPKG